MAEKTGTAYKPATQKKTDIDLTTTKDERAKRDEPVSAMAEYDRRQAEQDGKPPEDQAPGPEQDEHQPLQVVDNRAHVEAKDRNLFIGLVHQSDSSDGDPSGDYVDRNDLDRDDPTEVDGTPVDDAQVIGGNSGLVLILNGKAFHFGDIAGGILADLQSAALLKRNS